MELVLQVLQKVINEERLYEKIKFGIRMKDHIEGTNMSLDSSHTWLVINSEVLGYEEVQVVC